MTATATRRMQPASIQVPRHAFRRGTRGFAAFVAGLAGAVVAAVGARFAQRGFESTRLDGEV